MFVTDGVPSAFVLMFALSRPPKPGKPPVMPAACALPVTGSLPRIGRPGTGPVVTPKLFACEFHTASVKPRWYAQSWSALCWTNRLLTAFEMSAPTPVLGAAVVPSSAGLQPELNHAFVHG